MFGCKHKHVSFPFGSSGLVWRRCLDCGARRMYDWERMRSVGPWHYERVDDRQQPVRLAEPSRTRLNGIERHELREMGVDPEDL